MDLARFQSQIEAIYGARDAERGVPTTVAWIAEEVGELAQAVRKGSRADQLHELGDVLAWLASLANQIVLSLEEAASRFADRCPHCKSLPCRCALNRVLRHECQTRYDGLKLGIARKVGVAEMTCAEGANE